MGTEVPMDPQTVTAKMTPKSKWILGGLYSACPDCLRVGFLRVDAAGGEKRTRSVEHRPEAIQPASAGQQAAREEDQRADGKDGCHAEQARSDHHDEQAD